MNLFVTNKSLTVDFPSLFENTTLAFGSTLPMFLVAEVGLGFKQQLKAMPLLFTKEFKPCWSDYNDGIIK